MNEEFNEKNPVDHVTHDQEQEETVEHRHTEEPTQPSIIKRVWNHKIMLAVRRFLEKIPCDEINSCPYAYGYYGIFSIFSLYR